MTFPPNTGGFDNCHKFLDRGSSKSLIYSWIIIAEWFGCKLVLKSQILIYMFNNKPRLHAKVWVSITAGEYIRSSIYKS